MPLWRNGRRTGLKHRRRQASRFKSWLGHHFAGVWRMATWSHLKRRSSGFDSRHPYHLLALSSVAEQRFYTPRVAGPIPAAPTILCLLNSAERVP